jgi:cyclopropane-fatty-acyl-phospholipid synthase
MDKAAQRLESFRLFLTQLRERSGLDLGFRLWDGSTVPPDLGPKELTIAVADEGAVAALFRRPRVDTIAQLWAASRVDILNGTFFDVFSKRPKVRSKALWKSLDKKLLFGTATKFLFVPRGGPWPLEEVGEQRQSDGSAVENKKNIAYHYDVSNDFYALWLDKEMVYTCSYFTDWNNSLEQSQLDKLEMICRKLRLKPGETLLDIGCGWGALSCYAAQHYGVKAYGVTLSEQQVAYGQAKIARLGLGDRVKIELKDYSLVEGTFDKVASIGILEHVGIDNFPTYFSTVNRVLKPGGLLLHHAITRPGKSHAARTRRQRPEFKALLRYIFPGGELDYIGRTVTNLERYGFEIHDVEGWREHYQRTCRHWHDRLVANWDAAVKEVGPVKARIWLVYLAACSMTFERNNCGLYQTLASKRVRGGGPSGLPPTRADLYR